MFITQKEVAVLLSVSVGTVLRWHKKGLPYIKIPGTDTRYEKEKVLEWIKSFEKKEMSNDSAE